MNIYQIDERIRACEAALEDAIDPETGEIIDEDKAQSLMDALNNLDIDRKDKIEGACLLRREAIAEAAALDAEIKRLKARKDGCDRRADSLKDYVTMALAGEKFKTDKVSVYYCKSESVNILNEKALPDDYVKVTIEPKKDAIKKAIKSGHEVYGATLETKNVTVIR